jgi:zinc/manganese transport system substrate-binding protein
MVPMAIEGTNMKKAVKSFGLAAVLALTAWAAPAQAALRVFACEPEWAALAQELGGPLVVATSATTAQQDPHQIQARPSLIARVRNADLVACTGAELEAGWLPLLLQQSGNARVQPGQPGYFAAADQVRKLDIPASVDRSQGDVHAAGNPHIQTDPRNIAAVATALAARLQQLDPAQAAQYAQRGAAFQQKWQQATARWTAQAAPLRGLPVVSQHKGYVYLYDWLGMREVAVLEPKPGVEPSAAHLQGLLAALKSTPARMVISSAYQDPKPAEWLSRSAGLPMVRLPFTVGGSDAAKDLFGLFDDTIARLLAAAK